jgi:hypothetical protein
MAARKTKLTNSEMKLPIAKFLLKRIAKETASTFQWPQLDRNEEKKYI